MGLPNDNAKSHWRVDDIAFDKVDRSLIANDEFMFLTLAAASFTEILAELYSENLIEHFRGNEPVTEWLSKSWRHEEVQHGQALKKYVQTVWPEFDWEEGYRGFEVEYGSLCTSEQLEQNRSLELIARCVVETGTSSFYRALQHYVREPVLHQLLENIKNDEIAHYTHFRRYYNSYDATKKHGVAAICATMWRRLRAIESEDAYVALKHVHLVRYPGRPFVKADFRKHSSTTKRLARTHYPFSMAIKMLIKPVPLSESVKKILQWPLVGVARLISYT